MAVWNGHPDGDRVWSDAGTRLRRWDGRQGPSWWLANRVSPSIPCAGVHAVLCHWFSTLLPNSQISFAAPERWLVGTLKFGSFSGFRGLGKVALGIQQEQISGTPCFIWAGLIACWCFLSWQMEMEISKCWEIILVAILNNNNINK